MHAQCTTVVILNDQVQLTTRLCSSVSWEASGGSCRWCKFRGEIVRGKGLTELPIAPWRLPRQLRRKRRKPSLCWLWAYGMTMMWAAVIIFELNELHDCLLFEWSLVPDCSAASMPLVWTGPWSVHVLLYRWFRNFPNNSGNIRKYLFIHVARLERYFLYFLASKVHKRWVNKCFIL